MISFYFCWWGKAGSKKRARRKSAGSWRLIWPLREEEGFSRLRRWESHCRHRKQPGEEQKVWKRVQPLVTGSVSVRCTVQRGARSGGWGRHRNTQVRSKMRIPHRAWRAVSLTHVHLNFQVHVQATPVTSDRICLPPLI